jgi:Uma2 family endonuclease
MAERARVRFEAEDVWEAPGDDYRYEVIDGKLHATPSPSWQHQLAASNLPRLIGTYVRARGLGCAVPAPLGVVLDPETAVQPDLVHISRERAGLISARGIEGPPDLVVEVLSPKTAIRDRAIRMRRYAAAGIQRYWPVASEARTIESCRLGAQGYELTGTYGSGGTFQPDLFPGLDIPVDDLWT